MPFVKKILVLKQTDDQIDNNKKLSGIARIEIDGGVAELYLSIINLPLMDGFTYHAVVIDQKRTPYFFELGARPQSVVRVFDNCPDAEKGVAVGVYAFNKIPLTLAFSRSDDFLFSLSDFKKVVADKCLADRKSMEKRREEIKEQTISPSVTMENDFPTCDNKAYDDEVLATENYFSYDDKIIKDEENGYDNAEFQDELPFDRDQKKANEGGKNSDSAQDETAFTDGEKLRSGLEDRPYYLSVRKELESVFSRFPHEKSLEQTLPNSVFVKIRYSKDKFYVVGLIKEEGVEKYLCYGVPATYSPDPPKELKGYCSFIPLSVFDLSGDGYWMMFQDAVSGKCIHPVIE